MIKIGASGIFFSDLNPSVSMNVKTLVILTFALGFSLPAFTAEKEPEKKKNKASQKEIKEEKKQGGEYYEEYVTAMHNKRFQNEFTPAEWKTILLQKRVRVPFTAEEHRDLLLFFGD